jgi:hypothetical protein
MTNEEFPWKGSRRRNRSGVLASAAEQMPRGMNWTKSEVLVFIKHLNFDKRRAF